MVAAHADQKGLLLKILLVEDFVPMRDTVSEYLTSVGCEVLSASNGEEALQIVGQQEVIDILLTDIEMPGMNGIELWHRIHAILPAAKVLFLTGHPSELVSRHAHLPGEVISKPLNLPILHEKLKAL
jgi:CheY-like chemotaxis protein